MRISSTVEKSIEIIRWCLFNKKPLYQGCARFGHTRAYVARACKLYGHIADPQCREMISLYKKLQENDNFHSRREKKKSKGESQPEAIKEEGVVFDAESGMVDSRGFNHVKTLDEILSEAKVDLNLWEVERHLVNKWDVTNAIGGVFQNWQVKVWLKKREEVEIAFNFEQFYKELLTEHQPTEYKSVKYPETEKNLLEINIFDLHLGKLCWGQESGLDYDSKIASQRFLYALDQLILRSQYYKCERILFPVGNDFFNSDTDINTTHAGTWQAEDSRWQKTFKTGIDLLVKAIDYLRERAPVDVLVIPGNHDWTRSFFIGETLFAWYRNDKHVDINNSPNPRKYYEYGNTLLGFTHGHLEKPEALRSLMAYESKEAWARTRYKEFHCGHWHRKLATKHVVIGKQLMSNEELGIIIRHMGSMSGTDAWHHRSGYVGPNKSAEAFIWNYEDGLNAQFNVNINI